jgi:plastocyanin
VESAPAVKVTGSVVIERKGRAQTAKSDASNVVVWLKPVASVPPAPESQKIVIRQQNKRFDPSVLVVRVGSLVDFPNLDPFFHNVFSLFDGKRFDLGLYEAGATRAVRFDREGICYIFCNIHPEMSAVVVVVETPYFAISNRSGELTIGDVPPGEYRLWVWSQSAKPDGSTRYPGEVTITAENPTLPAIRMVDAGHLLLPHKNKYGREYETPAPPIIYK